MLVFKKSLIDFFRNCVLWSANFVFSVLRCSCTLCTLRCDALKNLFSSHITGFERSLLLTIILCIFMTGCSSLLQIGVTPEMTQGLKEPTKAKKPDIKQIKFPQQKEAIKLENDNNLVHNASLWQSGPESLFGDRRARTVGDILTVLIEIDDKAEVNNKTERTRDSSDNSSVTAGFGFDKLVDKNLPDPLSITPGLTASGSQATTGEGKINRAEKIELKIAAMVVDILPNGNFIIQGSQEVNVNYELRDLQISGIVRPNDISRKNTISYDKIAEARIFYGGRGNVSELQQPRYGSQFFDIIAPF